MLEKTVERPLEIKSVNSKGNKTQIFIGRTEAEAPIIWPSNVKTGPTGKDSDAGKDKRQEKEATEDEMAGWHHPLNGHQFEHTRDSEGQGSLECCRESVRHDLATEHQQF